MAVDTIHIQHKQPHHKGMLLTLEPLHKMVHLGPKTMKENSFVQVNNKNNLHYYYYHRNPNSNHYHDSPHHTTRLTGQTWRRLTTSVVDTSRPEISRNSPRLGMFTIRFFYGLFSIIVSDIHLFCQCFFYFLFFYSYFYSYFFFCSFKDLPKNH